jgi:hypothetical protein
MKYYASILHLNGGSRHRPESLSTLHDAVALRRKLFSALPAHVTQLSDLDWVATHVVIYAAWETNSAGAGGVRAVAAARIIHRSLCCTHGLPFPVEQLLEASPDEHRVAYSAFGDGARDVKQVQYFTISAGVRRREERVFLLEAMHWLFAKVITGTGGEGLVGIINARFKGRRWLEPLGSWPELLELKHPHSPDPHELILIKKFSADYLTSGVPRFRHLIAGA